MVRNGKKAMKEIRTLLVGMVAGVGLIADLHLIQAQTMVSSLSARQVNAMSDLQVMLQAVESVPPAPASTAPRGSTFYSAQHPPGSRQQWPALPANSYQLPVWNLGDGIFLLDDRNLDYDAIDAEANLAMALLPSMNMMASSLASSYAYGNPVYLTNLTSVFSNNGSVLASFSIGGGTNFVPYDILTSTNVAIPFSQWSWLGIGYTSNRYTFGNQPANNAFYVLAKPSRTITVAWGDDTFGQCDTWTGITNALQVSAGNKFSIALLNDGTVTGWGYNGATPSQLVPTNLAGVAMIASGWQHNVALLTNGMVTAWGDDVYGEINVPAGLSNVTVIAAQALHSLALTSNGMVVAWGYGPEGETNVPAGLANVTAIAAGREHNLVVSNGFVVAWGDNTYGQTNVPSGLSNVVDVAAGWAHSVALKKDGTVVCWGDNTFGETNVPAGLSNVVAIAAGGDKFLSLSNLGGALPYSLALKRDGKVVAWGAGSVLNPTDGITNVISIAGGTYHALAIRTGPPTPVVTLEPANQYQIAGGAVTFTAKGQGLYGITYQWQSNGVSISGATNATLALTNVQASAVYDVLVSDNGGMGSIVSSNANLTLITPPVITWQSQPTNIVCIYGNIVSFSATATAPGQTNGFPLHYQWQFNSTNLPGANTTGDSFAANDNSSGIYSLVVTNQAGSASASWQVTVTNAINVTNDLLLVYNSNSTDSSNLCAYYLAHRPMIGGANVLAVACDTNEITPFSNYVSQIQAPVQNWLTNNPSKRPQYVILFYGMPTRLQTYPANYGSVGYDLRLIDPTWQPYVNYINAGSLADCEAYVDKVAKMATNSPGQLIISASANGYANTNFVLDNVRHGPGFGDGYNSGGYPDSGNLLHDAIPAITNANSNLGITYIDGVETTNIPFLPHITNAVNVAGYICWGGHSNWGTNINDGNFPLDGNAQWSGNNGWWIIRTVESFNDQRDIGPGQSNFEKWFSSNAFGGTNYSNTPVGGVSYVEEPGVSATDNAIYFGLWASGKNFAICAWNSIQITGLTPAFQMVGDPFVTR
jgi:hypothetical protein